MIIPIKINPHNAVQLLVLNLHVQVQLYAKIPRDAFLMLIFKERPGGIIEVNELLSKNGMEMLRTSEIGRASCRERV